MLHKLQNHPANSKNRKRIGRGTGSGNGKTAGKGHKGQRARAGNGKRGYIGFEGGQMPIQRRIPKRGFKPINKEFMQLVNIGQLTAAIKDQKEITKEVLLELGLIKNTKQKVKLLGKTNKELPSGLTISVDLISHQLSKQLTDKNNQIKPAQ